jgi:hypothetical protein
MTLLYTEHCESGHSRKALLTYLVDDGRPAQPRMLHCVWKPKELVLLKLAPASKYNAILNVGTNDNAESNCSLCFLLYAHQMPHTYF